MARTMFLTTVVLKLVMWGLMAFGLYVAVRSFIDGNVGFGLLLVFIVIPGALWLASMVLGLASMVFLYPVALLTGKRKEFNEFTNFQLEVARQLQTNRLGLLQGKKLLAMFKELPPGDPSRTRTGAELAEAYDALHVDDEDDSLLEEEPSSV